MNNLLETHKTETDEKNWNENTLIKIKGLNYE